MKNFKYSYLLLLVSLLIGSCTNIEQEIFDSPTPENAIKTQSDVNNAIVGLYSQLNSSTGFKEHIQTIGFADDITSTSSQALGTWASKSGVNSGNGNLITIWTGLYKAIANANAVIAYAETPGLPAAFKAKTIGDAKFVRSVCYFYLVQYFGAVPIYTKVVDPSSDFYVGRPSIDENYNLIIEDFTEASKVLPTRTAQPASEFNRATSGAAFGFLAKAYLHYANYLELNGKSSQAKELYPKCIAAADQVINSNQYSLINDYAQLYNVANERAAYNEVLFGIAYTRDAANTTVTGEGSHFAFYFNPSTLANSGGNGANKLGSGAVQVQPWFADFYTKGEYAGDYRVESTFHTSWVGTNGRTYVTFPFTVPTTGNPITESLPYIKKFVDPAGLALQTNENDMFLLRFSQIYLIKAEAENELNGPSAVALEAFNKVRERARRANGVARTVPANITLANTPTKEDLRLKIFHERGLEFVGELNRYIDLIRMRYKDNKRTMYEYQFGEFLPKLVQGVPTFNTTTRVWSAGRTRTQNLVPFDKKYLLWPIPANEIGVNKNLTQNPGW
jgi:tetratricopeptide (TPR) repeat protein